MHQFRVLIVQQDPSGLALLTSMLKSLGHVIEEASSDRAAVRLLERSKIDLILAGTDPTDSDALELLTYVRRKHREIPIILLFSQVHPERSKEAGRLGATAILKYPVPAAELRATVMQALESCESRSRIPAQTPGVESIPSYPSSGPASDSFQPLNGGLADHRPASRETESGAYPTEHELSPRGAFSAQGLLASTPAGYDSRPAVAETLRDSGGKDKGLIGSDLSLRQILETASMIAPAKSPVLIQGEPGTGKSHLARIIHQMGHPADRPLITLHCSSFVESSDSPDFENPGRSRLPNWSTEWTSKLAMARGGTLLVEEVAVLPAELQLQLLRELQVRDYESISGQPLLINDVRFILTTSESLGSLVEQGQFRQELFHRISIVSLTLPPLRHRGADIEQLAEYFRARFAREYHRNIVGFTRDAIDVLHRHEWPGNLRELEGVVQRAVALCNSVRITASHLAPAMHQNRPSRMVGGSNLPRPHLPMGIRPLKEALEEPEKKIIIQALQAFNWNRQETARVLDINRTTLYKKMKKYGLLIDEPIWVN